MEHMPIEHGGLSESSMSTLVRRIDAANDARSDSFIECIKLGKTDAIKRQLEMSTPEERLNLVNTCVDGVPVLVFAIEQERPVIVRLLLNADADPIQTFSRCGNVETHETPLEVALSGTRPYITRMLVERYLRSRFLDRKIFLSLRRLEELLEEPHEQQTVRRTLVEIYSELPIADIIHGLPLDFRDQPACTLLDLLELAAATQRMALRTSYYSPSKSDDLYNSSTRLQLAAGGCLAQISSLKDHLGRFEVNELLNSPLGVQAQLIALKNNCRTFLTVPEVQAYFRSEWRGRLVERIFEISLIDGLRLSRECFRLLCAVVVAVVALPVFALLPMLETAIYERLCQRDFDTKHRQEQFKARGDDKLGSNRKLRRIFKDARVQDIQSGQSPSRPTPTSPAPGLAAVKRTVETASRKHILRQSRRPSSRNLEGSKQVFQSDTVFLYYLVRTPWFKFVTRLSSDIILAILVTSYNQADRLSVRYHAIDPWIHQQTGDLDDDAWSNAQYYNETWILFTLWAVGGIFSEWRQWLFSDDRKDEIRSFFEPDRLSMYRADFFNKLDFLCFHLMLVAIMLPVWKPYEHRAKAVLWSITCILAWMRLIRALQLTKYAGLVLIMIKMADDVFKLFVMIVPILLAYSAGIYVLFHSNIGSLVDTLRNEHLEQRPGEPLDWPRQCAGFDVLKHTLKDFLGFPEGEQRAYYTEILFVLFNSAFTGDTHIECLLHLVHPGLAWFAWFLTFTFLIITLVLLLNMLIAMMAKTFDNVWEASQAEAQYLFARLVFYQAQRAPEPPPLNTLRAPSLLASWMLRQLVHYFPNRDPERPRRLDRAYTFIHMSFQFGTRIDYTSARAINLVKPGERDSKGEEIKDEMINEYKGTTIKGTTRNTWESWKRGLAEEQLRESMLSYVTSMTDDVPQEKRWRSKMMKRISSLLEGQAKETEKGLASQRVLLNELKEDVRRLVEASAPRR